MVATNVLPTPKTLQEAIVYFSDPERCFDYAKKLRWPDGNVVCPRCNVAKNSFLKTRKMWFCYACKKQFSVKVKTIMEDSPITLDKWMTAFWLLSNAKNGISSHELGRALGVTQTTAWFMLQRIRKAMREDFGFGPVTKIGGEGNELEVDETFVGGKVKNMHRSRRLRHAQEEGYAGGATGKTIVQGILDRNFRKVRATVVPNVTREALQNEIFKNVKVRKHRVHGQRGRLRQWLAAPIHS
jgi:transposase-like protein